MPPVPQRENPPVVAPLAAKTFIVILSGVVLLIIIAGIVLAVWKTSQPARTPGDPSEIASNRMWTVCINETCAKTTSVDRNTLSPIPPGEYLNTTYMRSGNTIYVWDTHNDLGPPTLITLDADASTFEVFPTLSVQYGKDKNHVWFDKTLVDTADTSTFTAVGVYGHDATRVYYGEEIIPGADPKTHTGLSGSYSKDAKHVYFATTTIIGADAETFKMITDYEFGKDKNHVYDAGAIMPDVDPKTYVPPEP